MKARSLAIGVACAAVGLAAVCPRIAFAEGANIGLYTDVTGNTCSFSGNEAGPVSAYVVFRPDAGGVNTVQFSAPVPSCMGAVYLGETVTPGMMKLGNSQTGVSILLQACYGQPVSVLRIDYMRSGSTDPCCPYPILPDPTMVRIAASDCAYQEVPVTSVLSHFNADASCECEGNSPPSPPTAPLPQNGTPGHSITPQMSWFAQDYDDNIAEYDVYLGTSAPPALVASGLAAPTFTPPSPLAELTPHYWRVVVRDALGLEATGPVWSFTTRVANSPPFPPSSPKPASTVQDVLLNATLSWQGADIDLDPLTYDVYFGTAPSPPLVSANQAAVSYVPGPLVYSTTYYWRVVARDDDLLVTSGSEWVFTTRPSNYPPNAPSTPSPQNNATDRPVDITLSWVGTDRDNDPLVFDLYFGTTSPPPLVTSNLATATFVPPTMPLTTRHFWRVVARDTFGAETSGPTWNFTTGPLNYAPNVPNNPTPPHNSTNRLMNQTLAWTCSDPNNDPLTYDVYFGTASTPPLVASNMATATYAPGPLTSATRYYWRIRARDTHGATTFGLTWTFTTVSNNPPSAPANPTPPHNATNQHPTQTLMWDVSDPENQQITCDVYFGTQSAPPLTASGVTNRSYSPPSLALATTYYWRVRARDVLGAETWGPLWTFTTRSNAPPNAPLAAAPLNGAVNQPPNAALAWISLDPDGTALTHDVYFGMEADPPLVASNIATRGYVPGLLAFTTTYRWRIVVRDPLGAETSGPVWSFTTRANLAPIVPFNPVPANGLSSGLAPTLSWQTYDADLQPITNSVYFGTTLPPPLVESLLTVQSFDPGPLDAATQYYWRVVTTDGLLSSASPIWTFTAVVYGDVVPDGQVTVADASCALRLYLQDQACGGVGSSFAADVNCSGSVTPADARCIHRKVADGSCTFCQDGTASESAVVHAPLITLTHTSTREDTLVARLAVSPIASFASLGFSVATSPKVRLVDARRRGATNSFTALDLHETSPGAARVGGYSLSETQLVTTTEFIELRFDISHGLEGTLRLEAFVDDLFHGSRYTYALGDVVSASPTSTGLALHQNHPNPFNPQTTITYDLPSTSERVHVRLWIIDISGRVVKTLVDEDQSGGSYRVDWQGKDDRGESVSSGVYFFALDAGGERRTRKLVLLK